MKNLLKRLRNLWALSNFEVTENKLILTKNEVTNKLEVEQPKQAQIIKMNNPVKGFLKETN